MPRNGFAGATTWTPLARSRSTTPFQLDASANAPCTRTTVRGAAAGVASVIGVPSCTAATSDGPTRPLARAADPAAIPEITVRRFTVRLLCSLPEAGVLAGDHGVE